MSPFIFGTDASPDGAGLIACNAGTAVTTELFRRTDGRGFHTRLLSEVGAYLHSVGLVPHEPEFLIENSAPPGHDESQDLPRPAESNSLITACHLPLELPALQGLAQKLFAASLRVRDMSSEGDFL